MTTLRIIDRSPATHTSSIPAAPALPQPGLQLRRRERDFGVGYGNSSGYASDKRYANAWGHLRFRCG